MPRGRTHCDRISNLPSSIVQSILMRLSTLDAARTSILSRKWRYQWTTLPQIILDGSVWEMLSKNRGISKEKFLKVFYQILALRQEKTPLLKFVLSVTGLEICPEIDNLIVLLSKSKLSELTLELLQHGYYKLPSSFFSFQELRELSLLACLIAPPASFKGFSKLTIMKLSQVEIPAKVLGSLISSCPLLETLKLEMLENYYLEISAPKLKSLTIEGPMDVVFKNTPLLAMVVLLTGFEDEEEEIIFPQLGEGVGQHFGHLPSLQELRLDYYFVKSLSVGGIPTRVTTALIHLKVLEIIFIRFDLMDEITFVLCLLGSSPHLQEIYISARYDEIEDRPCVEILQMLDRFDATFNELRKVYLRYIYGLRPEMELIRLLLERSPVLEKMLIDPCEDDDTYKRSEIDILKEVNRYPRASSTARVIFRTRFDCEPEFFLKIEES